MERPDKQDYFEFDEEIGMAFFNCGKYEKALEEYCDMLERIIEDSKRSRWGPNDL